MAVTRWRKGGLWLLGFKKLHLFSQELLLCPTALPAVPPVQYQELKAEGVDLDRWLKTYTQVVVVHFVELRARVEETDVAGDRKKEIVVEGWQFGQLVLQHLRCCFRALAFLLDFGLYAFGKDLVGQLS